MSSTTSSTQRPSRLLNLNKSPASMKRIATTNDASSPLLRLPAEVRSRIYDFAFGECIVHIFHGIKKPYALAMCQCPDVCENAPTRLNVRVNPKEVYSLQSGAAPLRLTDNQPNRTCWNYHMKGWSLSSDLPLHLLATCRQIYHEAVLRPFSQILFIYDPAPFRTDDLGGFLDALVPAQARAITHLRLTVGEGNFPSPVTFKKLGKLERLHVSLNSGTHLSLKHVLDNNLRGLGHARGLNAIGKLFVKSLKITYEAGLFEFNHSDTVQATAEAIIKWLEDVEARLLQPAT